MNCHFQSVLFVNNNESNICINKPQLEGMCQVAKLPSCQFANSDSARMQKQVSSKLILDTCQLWQQTVLYSTCQFW